MGDSMFFWFVIVCIFLLQVAPFNRSVGGDGANVRNDIPSLSDEEDESLFISANIPSNQPPEYTPMSCANANSLHDANLASTQLGNSFTGNVSRSGQDSSKIPSSPVIHSRTYSFVDNNHLKSKTNFSNSCAKSQLNYKQESAVSSAVEVSPVKSVEISCSILDG